MSLHLPPRLRRTTGLASLGVVLLVLASCSSADQDQIARLAMPESATDRGPVIFELWRGAWIAAMAIGVLVWGLIGYSCVKFRRRRDDEIPVQTRYNRPLVILFSVAPIVLVLVFFYYTVIVQNEVLADVSSDTGESPDHTIQVVGFQWSWAFNYLEDEALDGSTTVYEGGTTGDEPTLVLPVDETVKINLTSPDVIHSFWVPAFLFKMDVVPGRQNTFSVTPTELGTYQGRCAELCGAYHSRMLFKVKIVSADEYATYLQSLEDKGQTGLAIGGSNADTQAGLEEEVQDNEGTGSSQ